MCDRKKRCTACKKVLPITEYNTYRKKDGTRGCHGICISCERRRDSKTSYKRKVVLEAYINRTMYHINGRDY